MRRSSPLIIAAAIVALRWIFRARVPDDPDSIDFLLGMSERFDLALLQPHFPGYPVFIALGALLVRLGVPALSAALAISSLSSGATALALGPCARRLAQGDDRASPAAMVLWGAAWLPGLVGGSALSDALGTALSASAFALLALDRPRPMASGFLGGLILGTRASYWPFAGSLFVLAWRAGRPQALRAALGFFLGTLAWAVPFFSIVAPKEFLRLGKEHLAGHFEAWGGSIATRPDVLARAGAFVRALLYDGFAPSPYAVVAILAAAGVTFILARRAGRPFGQVPPVSVLAAVVGPYAAWVFLAQNIVDQPRHVLPLLGALFAAAACALVERPRLWAALAAIALITNLPLAFARAAVPPAAAQAAEWIRAGHPRLEEAEVVVFATRSVRHFQAAKVPVRQRQWLSEVILDLARFDRFPAEIYVTSEIDLRSGGGPDTPLPHKWRVEPGPVFCRDQRIDRASPCLGLSKLAWSPR